MLKKLTARAAPLVRSPLQLMGHRAFAFKFRGNEKPSRTQGMSTLDTEGMPSLHKQGELGQGPRGQSFTKPLKVDFDPDEVSFQSDKKFS